MILIGQTPMGTACKEELCREGDAVLAMRAPFGRISRCSVEVELLFNEMSIVIPTFSPQGYE